MAWTNPVRARLAAGEPAFALTITVPSAEIAAQAATMGFHLLWVEMEHSPITLETLRNMVLATRGMPAAIFARVPAVERWMAKRVLDQGVSGVIFPFTSTPDLAKTAGEATKYPPHGRRGSGAGLATVTWPDTGVYYDSADREVMTVCVIEDREGLENVEKIAATPGVDVLFIGTSDLSFSLGLRGRQDEPELLTAIDRIKDAARAHGKYLGRPAVTTEQAHRFREEGFLLLQAQTETGFFAAGVKAYLKEFGIEGLPREKRALY